MKLKKLHPLRSNFNFPITFSKKKVGVGCTKFESRLEKHSKALSYKPKSSPRITFVRKFKKGYHAVGMGIIKGDLATVKRILSDNGYTGMRMGGLVFSVI